MSIYDDKKICKEYAVYLTDFYYRDIEDREKQYTIEFIEDVLHYEGKQAAIEELKYSRDPWNP